MVKSSASTAVDEPIQRATPRSSHDFIVIFFPILDDSI
jgi:hypothetical protein